MITTEQYQEQIIYSNFLEKNNTKITNLSYIKANIKEINAKCINKNFIFILLFERWIYNPNCEEYYESRNVYQKNPVAYTFNSVNLFPLKSKTLDRFILFDIQTIIEIFNALGQNLVNNNSKLAGIYEYLEKNLPNRPSLPPLRNHYINKNFENITKANSGLYIDLLNLFQKDKKEYLISYADFSRKPSPYINGESLIKDFMEKIQEIKLKKITDFNTIFECISFENKIKKVGETIISFFNLILKMTVSMYKQLNGEDIDDIKINFSSEGKPLSIEQLLNQMKPMPKPAFKKSYVVREANLTPFIEIKMLYYKNNDFLEINNFNIPYNNILSLDHNVFSNNITINLIDTEGEISELLIYKMYQITTQISESKKINNISFDASLPYVFQVEYGWSGPESEDQEELLDNRVFTKKNFRGYIRSISSQFKQTGVEYTLEILPVDYENNFFDSGYYNIFYGDASSNNNNVNFNVAIFMLYFILKYYEKPDLTTIFSQGNYERDTFDLSKIFYFIEGKETPMNIFLNADGTYNIAIAVNNEATKITNQRGRILAKDIGKLILNVNPNDEKKVKLNEAISDDKKLITKLIKGLQVQKHKEGGVEYNYVNIKDIKINNLQDIINDLNTTYSLNSWLVGLYFIWELKEFFIKPEQSILIHDTTGLFDVFDNKLINETKFFDIIDKFNVFCLDENEKVNKSNFFETIKKTITDDKYNKYNKYYLEDIIDPHIGKPTNNVRKLTFFNEKIQKIFKEINNLGLNRSFDENNVYQFASSVDADFNTYKDFDPESDIDDLYYEQILRNYKRRIYANKNVIFSPKKFSKDEKDERDKDSFDKLNNNFSQINKQSVSNLNIMYLSYNLNKNKMLLNDNLALEKKISFLAKNILQSYSLMPRIIPKTRNSNKQFFSQGNDELLREGTGDIIEFTINDFDIGKISSINMISKNVENIGFNDLYSQTFINGLYDNAAKYYNVYTNINGEPNKIDILKNLAILKLNYQNQITVSASITIIGEPYWSSVDFVNRSVFIYLNIYYNSGALSEHTGVYTIENITQNIQNNKFTTKLDLKRAPTFLNNLNNFLSEKQTTFNG